MEKCSYKAFGVGWLLGAIFIFPFFPIQGDLPSYTSEDKSPLGT